MEKKYQIYLYENYITSNILVNNDDLKNEGDTIRKVKAYVQYQ